MTLMVTVTVPVGIGSYTDKNGNVYTPNSLSQITIPRDEITDALRGGFTVEDTYSRQVVFKAPIASELISVKAAATPANGTITIAAQPDYPRKLNIRIVIGTSTTTAITAGTLTLVGIDQDGNTVSEVISLIYTSTPTTPITKNVYAKLTSGTVAGYVASGSGTGNTLGIGVSNALGLPTQAFPAISNLTVEKETLITSAWTGSTDSPPIITPTITAADEAPGTFDAVARSVIPGTAANALNDYIFLISWQFGAL